MARRSSRRRPTGRRRRWNLGQYGVVLIVCLAGLFLVFAAYALIYGLGSAQLPRGLR